MSATPQRHDLQKPTGIVFDLDGTLVDTTFIHTLCWWQAFQQFGENPPMAAVHRAIGMGAHRLVDHILGADPDRSYDVDIISAHDALLRAWHGSVRPLAGAVDLLAWCRQAHVTLVLATSSGERDLQALLGVLGHPTFDVVVKGEDAEESKPAPDSFQVAVNRAGLDPWQTLFAGDSVWDMQAIAAIDGIGVGLECGGTSEAELREAGAKHVFRTPAELLAAVQGR